MVAPTSDPHSPIEEAQSAQQNKSTAFESFFVHHNCRIMPRQQPNPSSAQVLSDIERSLRKEVVDTTTEPSLERCKELVGALQEEAPKNKMTVALLRKTQLGVTLGKTIKTIRRHKRTVASSENEEWSNVLDSCQSLLSSWKEIAKQNQKNDEKDDDSASKGKSADGLPSSVASYRSRLARQSKDMYKDPPSLPPASIAIEADFCSLPKRNKATGLLTFPPGQDDSVTNLLKDFHPNRTPEEVLRAGSFGGTYFRPIVSAVTNIRYSAKQVLEDTVQQSWIKGLEHKMLLTSSTYRKDVNKYGVKCGGSLGMWESSGWIADSDPYGWFQWYCRFYHGRRCSDDARQISRWLKSAGPKGRFRSQLCNKILAANAKHDDQKISPVIRQTLLHWGLEITPDVLEKHKKRK